jgi:hypothetical protein
LSRIDHTRFESCFMERTRGYFKERRTPVRSSPLSRSISRYKK